MCDIGTIATGGRMPGRPSGGEVPEAMQRSAASARLPRDHSDTHVRNPGVSAGPLEAIIAGTE
ncbi:hypothetical protein [Mycobacterium branderi]|uniref:hypothetical protein n=1 Tax=Mycobacterium branderi TaxID=43348 RepID=UPI00111C477E|nr:hypothetical protein [Mycobacterium branderi]MCV7234653.1 hypothetical protein [Mycobacterium branderi]